MGVGDADSAEHGSGSPNPVIAPVACPIPGRSPKLCGKQLVRLKPGSRLAQIYGSEEAEEEFFCNYEVNPQYEARFEAAGLEPVAWGERGEWRAVELPGHRFFLATLFQPQLSSRRDRPHPILAAYLKAAAARCIT